MEKKYNALQILKTLIKMSEPCVKMQGYQLELRGG